MDSNDQAERNRATHRIRSKNVGKWQKVPRDYCPDCGAEGEELGEYSCEKFRLKRLIK